MSTSMELGRFSPSDCTHRGTGVRPMVLKESTLGNGECVDDMGEAVHQLVVVWAPGS